jgi:hypothetical protein
MADQIYGLLLNWPINVAKRVVVYFWCCLYHPQTTKACANFELYWDNQAKAQEQPKESLQEADNVIKKIRDRGTTQLKFVIQLFLEITRTSLIIDRITICLRHSH